MASSEGPLELGRSVSSTDHLGNLSLCRTDAAGIECLGKTGAQMTSRTGNGLDDDAQYSQHPKLNWRYEKGLLRSVGPDGISTTLCLGPIDRIKVLDGTTGQPYELVLQECPHIPGRSENIFVHPEPTTTTTTKSTTIDAASAPAGTKPAPPTKSYARHMQYLMQGDGRIQSLAPVFDDITNPGEDLVAKKPFCVTIMKWGDDNEQKAYLVPCHRENENTEEAFDSQETIELLDDVKPRQQRFDTERGSSFDSFLLDLNSKDTNFVQFAYQIGFSSDSSPSLSDKNNYEDFESIVIQVMTEGLGYDSTSQLVSERILSSVWANNERQSGIVSYKFSSFKKAGKMEAHIMGRSMGGLETTWLASTTFEVPNRFNIFPNGWTWSLVVFTGIMFCYIVLVKANNLFCPTRSRRKRTRNSELTAVTSNTNNNSDMDWGIIPMLDLSLPTRISEEEVSNGSDSNQSNMSSPEFLSSVYDRTVITDTTATDRLDSTLDSREDNDVEGQEELRR